MTKYFLNIRQSGKTKKDNEQTYEFDLETPLSFPFYLVDKHPSWHPYKKLEVKTQKTESEFFHNTDGKGGIGGEFSPITTYWNLCVPDDNKGFTMTGYNDILTLDDKEGKIYLELYNFPRSTLTVKPKGIFIVVEGESLNITVEPFKMQEEMEVDQIELKGEKFTNFGYQSLIQDVINNKKELKFNFHSNNNTYFSKTLKGNSKKNNVLVIPENSLQEDLTTQNQNSSSSSLDKTFYLLLGAIVIVSLCLIFFLTKLWKSRKK